MVKPRLCWRRSSAWATWPISDGWRVPDHLVHDPDLLDALEAIEPRPFDQIVWRVSWATRDPLLGGTGGGRWHPPNDFETLYASLDEHGAIAEIYHHLSRSPVFSSSHVKINQLRVRAERTLVFADIKAFQVCLESRLRRQRDLILRDGPDGPPQHEARTFEPHPEERRSRVSKGEVARRPAKQAGTPA